MVEMEGLREKSNQSVTATYRNDLYRTKMRALLVLCFLLNILLSVFSAKIETNETNAISNVEKSSNNATAVVADTKTDSSSNSPSYAVAPSFFSSDFWRSGFGQALSIGGVVATTLALLGGLTWLFAPFFGLRMCNLFGNCEKAITYNSGGNLQDPNLQAGVVNDAQYMSPYNSIQSYYKRSIDTVGPIIKKLASTVEKIEQIRDNHGSSS